MPGQHNGGSGGVGVAARDEATGAPLQERVVQAGPSSLLVVELFNEKIFESRFWRPGAFECFCNHSNVLLKT